MDERPDQIIGHIEAQRDQLGRNLNELETRVRQSTDWRTYYDRNPMLMMGAALGGGLLLGSMVGSKTGERKHRYSGKSRSKSSYSSTAMGLSSAGVGAAAASSSSRPSYSSSSGSHSGSSLTSSKQWNEVSQTMDHIKTALISFGMAKAKEFLGQAIPGIDQHLSEAEKRHQGQGYNRGQQQGSTAPAEQFADSAHLPRDRVELSPQTGNPTCTVHRASLGIRVLRAATRARVEPKITTVVLAAAKTKRPATNPNR